MSVNLLKTTILDLIEDLKNNIFTKQDEKGDIMMVEFIFKRMHPEQIMQHIISHIVPWKEKIRKKDENFFLENKNIFKGLPEDRIIHYGNVIVNSGRLDNEDKKIVWEYFSTIVEIAETYKKTK